MMASIFDWSTTAADNDDADSGINWAEQQDPDTVNNSARTMMQRFASWLSDQNASARESTGSDGDYVITSATQPSALTDRFTIWFKPNHTNATAATLKVDSFPAKPLRAQAGVNLESGEIITGIPTGASYNSANDEFLALNSAAPAALLVPDVVGQHAAGLRVGDVVITMDATPRTGRVRLDETPVTVNKADYPELDQRFALQGYPFGATATTFDLPPAGGYFLRFAASDATVDPDGPRTAGSTQQDEIKSHLHDTGTMAGTAAAAGDHAHTYLGLTSNQSFNADTGGAIGTSSYTNTATSTASGGSHGHSVSLTGSTGLTGGDETRSKNVAFYADMIASAAAANADVYGVNGLAYNFSTSITGNPGSGNISFNNATLSAATSVMINDLTSVSGDVSDLLTSWGSSVGGVNKGHLHVYKVGNPGIYAAYYLNAVPTDSGDWHTATVQYIDGSGSFSSGDPVGVLFVPSGSGEDGEKGEPGIKWAFDSDTTMADPGAGDARLNNASLASVTEIAISYLSGETGNPTVEDFVKSWDDSTTLTNRGLLTLKRLDASENFAIYKITSAVTDNTTWGQFTVSHVASAGTLTGDLGIAFSGTGDKGTTGAGTGDLLATNNLSDVINAAASRQNLNLEIGADVQAHDVLLDDLAGLSPSQGDIFYYNGSNLTRLPAGTSGDFLKTLGAGANPVWDAISGGGDLLAANNLSDVVSAATAFANIKQAASDTSTGAVELATNTEAETGTDTSRAVTSAGVKASITANESFTPFASRAKAHQTSVTSIPSATTTAIDFDVEDFDTDSYYETVTNPERFTIPSGVSTVILHGYLQTTDALSGTTNYIQVSQYNSSDVLIGFTLFPMNGNFEGFATGLFAVSATDYFTMSLYQNKGSSVALHTDGRNYMSISAVA